MLPDSLIDRRKTNPKLSDMSQTLPDGVWAFGSSTNNTCHPDPSAQYMPFDNEYSIIASDPEAEWMKLPLDSSCELSWIRPLGFFLWRRDKLLTKPITN